MARSTSGQLLQLGQIPIELIRVSTIRISIRVLPDSLIGPSARNRARRASVPSQHKRRGSTERLTVSGAGSPPIIGRIDQWIPPCFAVVGVDEVLDPGYHCGSAKPVAGRARGVVFDVEHSWESLAIA